MEDSIFTKIINGELPSYKIAENKDFIAFLDLMPLRRGHTLVVPKAQVDYIYDLSDNMLSELMVFSKVVAKKIESKIKCTRIGIAVIGLEVPHVHIHLIPIDSVSDMDFNQKKLNFSKEEMQDIVHLINQTV